MQTKTTLAEDNQANSEGEINLDEGLEILLGKSLWITTMLARQQCCASPEWSMN